MNAHDVVGVVAAALELRGLQLFQRVGSGFEGVVNLDGRDIFIPSSQIVNKPLVNFT